MQKEPVRDLAGEDFLSGFEKIFGPVATAALKETMRETYFGTDDIASIIQTRPDLFERAMNEIFGKACPTVLSLTTADSHDRESKTEMKVGNNHRDECRL